MGMISIKKELPRYGKQVLFRLKAPHWMSPEFMLGARTHTDVRGENYDFPQGVLITHWIDPENLELSL